MRQKLFRLVQTAASVFWIGCLGVALRLLVEMGEYWAAAFWGLASLAGLTVWAVPAARSRFWNLEFQFSVTAAWLISGMLVQKVYGHQPSFTSGLLLGGTALLTFWFGYFSFGCLLGGIRDALLR